MRGGKEEPCLSAPALKQIQKDPTRICPRVELTEENLALGEIAWFAVKLGGDHPLFNKLFDLQTVELDAEAKIQCFYKIITAVSDDGIAARIKAERERALRNRQE